MSKSNILGRRRQQGTGMLFFLATIILILVLFFTSISVIRYVTLQTRLHHAADNALAIVAREGLAVEEAEGLYLAKTFIIYNLPIGIRNQALKQQSDLSVTLSALGYEDNLSLSVEQSTQPVAGIFPTFTAKVERKLIRQIETMETVMSLDLSRSMSDKIGGGLKPSVLMPTILTRFIEAQTGEQDLAEDRHIGLVPYSTFVNVGREYQDKLITPDSRRIPADLKPVANAYGYDDDFLNPLGVEGQRHGACVQRKVLVPDLVPDVLKVPASPNQGFKLMIYHHLEPLSAPNLRREIIDANSGRVPAHLLPIKQDIPDGRFIETPGGCPSMAIHEISGRTSSLKDRAKQYFATHNTGGDAGLIWAWRLLDARWRENIWKDPGFELDEPKQRILLFTDGKNNQGLQDEDFTRFLSKACTALEQQEVRVDVILFDQGISEAERNQYRQCAITTGGSYHYVLGDDLGALQLFFARLGIRQYKIRFI